ncbi:aminotransferase class III-fold pyridoxal phosphate-dependent enzyme [Candidatus Poribacteria bacterium]|jgi:taurine-pyruvate aminotransferase|nr:aminotransferase class III-fold pyridoxal phosphate-dependent enzyme [Candidatus Poribacteria bacterium]MBT5534521.1 aminotransferase class III-fold pyridoxal phosphate-dependent enzyme [Candidatus Poribacteria bacterium]MBT5714509.1 aminotransferase class III-fold pyridoxal phosphate-dependent enzyme [Candidatus Poribacteria bacterium]MBT7805799.1 aminotransferase class III-fold pyridoxal phosphate-dependent enzyme [Candidatus Poribacteria bacterium]
MAPNERATTSQVVSMDREHVWHPMTQHTTLQRRDIGVMREAKGAMITDGDGREYLDAYAGLWNVNVGYGRDEIADAVSEQIRTLPYYPHTRANEPAARLAEMLAEILPGDLQYIFYSNSGSEANETAIKMARQYARQQYPGENRYKIISRYQAYHGFTYGAMSATGQVPRRRKFEPLAPGFIHVSPPYCFRCPIKLTYPECGLACVEEFEEVIQREGPDTVAAIIAEPIIGGGGIIAPPDDYFPRLREICDEYGVLLIFDEVITGFGRTGELFGANHWDVVPDIMTMAKGVTSGYLPLGVCAATPRVYDAFLGDADDGREFAQVVTYGGHPVCCAAGVANIEILMRERLWENSAKVGAYLQEQLTALDSPHVGDVRGKGLMIAVELVDDDGAPLDKPSMDKAHAAIVAAGVLVGRMSHVLPGPESIFYLSPPLIITEADADRIVGAIRQGLATVA